MEVLLPDEIGMGFRKNITFVVKFKGATSFLLFFSRMTKISNFLYRDYSSFLAEHFDGKVQKLSEASTVPIVMVRWGGVAASIATT